MKDIIYEKDVMLGLDELADDSIDCCVTSPPYWGLRDYDMADQLGQETTPEQYIDRMVTVFEEVRRVLKKDGTLWLNIGDTYANGKIGRSDSSTKLISCDARQKHQNAKLRKRPQNYKAKDLIGIPWMLAFALRNAGWYLRQEIIWHKPNPMPESVKDRCTRSHEQIFLMSKSPKYYYDSDAIKTPLKDESIRRVAQAIENGAKPVTFGGKKHTGKRRTASGKPWKPNMSGGGTSFKGHKGYYDSEGKLIVKSKANKKSVWTVTTKSFKAAHFATFPPDLIIDCIKAGCPVGGIVLDPFMGAATTAIVAKKLDRHYIGYELNPEYIQIANQRMYKELGMFA